MAPCLLSPGPGTRSPWSHSTPAKPGALCPPTAWPGPVKSPPRCLALRTYHLLRRWHMLSRRGAHRSVPGAAGDPAPPLWPEGAHKGPDPPQSRACRVSLPPDGTCAGAPALCQLQRLQTPQCSPRMASPRPQTGGSGWSGVWPRSHGGQAGPGHSRGPGQWEGCHVLCLEAPAPPQSCPVPA